MTGDEGSGGRDDLRRFIDNDAYARHLAIQVERAADGFAEARMKIENHHLNSAGILHGGAIFSLADAAFSAASNSRGSLAVAINVSVSFFKAVRSGTLTAEAREAALSPRLATYLMDVRDEGGALVAHLQGTVYRKKESIADIAKS